MILEATQAMMTNRGAGLAVLIAAGAIVAGYLVYRIVPPKHFPRTAGLLAANVIVGALAYAGNEIAGEMLGGCLIVSGFFGWLLILGDLG